MTRSVLLTVEQPAPAAWLTPSRRQWAVANLVADAARRQAAEATAATGTGAL